MTITTTDCRCMRCVCPTWCTTDHDKTYSEPGEHTGVLVTFDRGTVDLFLSGDKTLDVILWLDGDTGFTVPAADAGPLLRDLGRALLVSADQLEAVTALG